MKPPPQDAPPAGGPVRYDAAPEVARWAALEAAFEAASALAGDDRARWLAACEARDPALAAEVRGLLAADAAPGVLDALAGRLTPARVVLDGGAASTDRTAGPDDAPGPDDAAGLPTRVGPYVVAGEIGRGGMGVVWRAHDSRLGRDVALKVFPHAADGDAAERRVLAEARAASALDHPHICTIYDVGTLDDGRPYLAMAYYPGGTLGDRLAAGPFPPRRAAEIACQLADALACAHAAGIVHRDVKPRNVAFGERGGAKLLDFGVALLRDRGERAGSAGTPAYMAPEQVRGDAVDGRADVWALGVVLFEMLCGRRPFAGADRRAVLRAILHDAAPDVRAVRPGVPPALAAVTARALCKELGGRWPSAGALGEALQEVLADPPRRSPLRWPSRGSLGRSRRPVAAGALLLAAGAAATAAGRGGRPAGAAAAAPPPAAAASAGAGDLVDRARARYHAASAEGLEEAITLLRLALAGGREDAAAHALLARAYTVSTFEGRSRSGQTRWLDSAAAHARRAAEVAPRSPDGWSALGVAYAALGRHAEAIVQLRRAVDLAPGHASAMMDLARSYAALRQYEEAVVWMERALRTDPALPGGHARAAQRYRYFDLPDEARRHVEAGMRVTPTEPYLWRESIQLALAVGDTADARRQLAEYLPLVPPPEHPRLRAWFEFLRGDARAARPHVDRAVGSGWAANDLRAYGIIYALTGDRARGDSLLGREERRLRQEARSGRDLRPGAVFEIALVDLAHVHAVRGERAAALATLAQWDSTGGFVPWRTTLRQPGWEAVRDDPRFREIVARSDARLRAARARMAAQLGDLRAAGALPAPAGAPRAGGR